MKLLFVADPLPTFKIHKDSTFAMMREAQARGHEVWACDTTDLQWQSGQSVSAALQACASNGYYFQATNSSQIATGFTTLTDKFLASVPFIKS